MKTKRINKIAVVMPWHINEKGGGAEVQANYLSEELAKRGFDVTYICQTTNAEKVNTAEVLGLVNIMWLKTSSSFQWLDQEKYLLALDEISPDLIVQRLSSNITYVIGKYVQASNAKFAWICTDNLSPLKDLHIRRYKLSLGNNSINIFKKIIFYFNNKLMDYYRNKGMNYVDFAFTQNDFQKESLLKEFNLESFRMISGHLKPTRRISSKDNFDKRKVLWCANLGRNKRPDLFIQLARRFENDDYEFVMVGGHSNKQYKSDLFKDRPTNLKVIGQVSYEESLRFFDETTLLINTSISEGFSNTYIQSWLRGVPTIVLGADPSSVIVNNSLGFNVSSVNELEAQTRKLLTNFNMYDHISSNVLKYAEDNHTVSKMTDNFLSYVLS